MTRTRVVLVLGIIAAGICLATGVMYGLWAERDASNPSVAFLAALGYLGVAALAAAALWQRRAVDRTRIIVLIVLSGLAAGYAAANVLALKLPPTDASPPLLPPRGLHLAGLVAGSELYVGALIETTFTIRDERRASRA